MKALGRSIDRLIDAMERGLTETTEVLGAIARTDLSGRVRGDHRGAFAKLQADTNSVADRLTEVMSELRHTSGQLKLATQALSVETRDLSMRAAQEFESVGGASAAVGLLSTIVADNARRAEIASARGRDAAHAAQGSHQIMAEARATMARMEASSASISDLMETIDAVASSTSLLALNASIEAVRAGQAGRGFAIVAQELKSSAQRAAEAAGKAHQLADRSREELGAGSQMMVQVTESLEAMQAAVRENSAQLQSIALANLQEAEQIQGIRTSITGIEHFARDNMHLATQLSDAMTESGARAAELDRIVETFSVDRSRGSRAEAA